MTKIPVLVTGIGGGGTGEQILKALRLAKGLDLHIIGTDLSPATIGRKYVDTFHTLPAASSPSYGKDLSALITKYGVRFLFHGSEPELKYISEHRQELNALGASMYINTGELIAICLNKQVSYQKLGGMGVELPRYLKIDTMEDLKKVDFFPAVLKPNTSSGGSSHVYIVRDPEELQLLGQYLLRLKVDLIVQEYVGGPDAEYTIGVNSNADGVVQGSLVIKRVIGNAVSTRLRVPSLDRTQTYVISSGFSQGAVCHMPDLQKQAERVATLLDSRGPLNVQCRFVKEKLLLMEINPRLSGTTSLRAQAGYNEPAMFIRHTLDGTPWSRDYRDMLILRGLEEIEIVDEPAGKALVP